jgi:hypothetical protein
VVLRVADWLLRVLIQPQLEFEPIRLKRFRLCVDFCSVLRHCVVPFPTPTSTPFQPLQIFRGSFQDYFTANFELGRRCIAIALAFWTDYSHFGIALMDGGRLSGFGCRAMAMIFSIVLTSKRRNLSNNTLGKAKWSAGCPVIARLCPMHCFTYPIFAHTLPN